MKSMLEVRRQETDIFFSRKFPKLSTLMVLCHETPPLTFFRQIAHLLKSIFKYVFDFAEIFVPKGGIVDSAE